MRRLLPWLGALLVAGAFLYTLLFLYQKSTQPEVVYETERAAVQDITQKTVASGSIVPRREVPVKPQVSGILEELMVEPGALVKAGEQVARIRIVPDVVRVNTAEGRVDAARIRLRNRQQEHRRLVGLRQQGLIGQAQVAGAQLETELAQQELRAARDNLQLVKEGAIRGSGKVSNVVLATVPGMVVDVPVKAGVSVIETNTFSEGTTLAVIADMRDLVFEGFVDETEVGKLHEGMAVHITIGALKESRFEGRLEHIAPKGTEDEGTIKFKVRAALSLLPDTFVRANYSANASIVLDRREQVLALPERLLQFEGKRPYVEVETQPQVFEKRFLELGLSDGLLVEVTEGLEASDSVKVPQAAGS